MAGFDVVINGLGTLGARVDTVDAKFRGLGATVGGTDVERAIAEIERLKAAIAEIDLAEYLDSAYGRTHTPAGSRSAGIREQLAAAERRLEQLRAADHTGDRGEAGHDDDGPIKEVQRRVAVAMGSVTNIISTSAAAAEKSLDDLSTYADEITTDVEIKISKALSKIIDPGAGEGLSGNYDPDTGQFLGGAFSYERARKMVEDYIRLQDMKSMKLDAIQTYYLNDSIIKTSRQFTKEFGSKLGDIKTLAKQLREYLDALARNDRADIGQTSGALSTKRTAQTASATSFAVLRWSGVLR